MFDGWFSWVVMGDDKAVGSVFRVSISEDLPFAKSVREKIVAVDDAKRTLILDVAGIDEHVFHIWMCFIFSFCFAICTFSQHEAVDTRMLPSTYYF
ncbi:unnamed protein product [Lupinus luteus]|uniref:Uncharacterized protein n=1 Tax=Lupinus luteus TaxID=3873 RepID=A0AAV1WPE0_LUPLU